MKIYAPIWLYLQKIHHLYNSDSSSLLSSSLFLHLFIYTPLKLGLIDGQYAM